MEFEGLSGFFNFQEALERARVQAVMPIPGGLREVPFTVTKIHGRRGGIAGLSELSVVIDIGIHAHLGLGLGTGPTRIDVDLDPDQGTIGPGEFEGISQSSNFQEALERAVGMALTPGEVSPPPDREVSFTVTKINGHQGGIDGLSELSVVIGDAAELGTIGPGKFIGTSQNFNFQEALDRGGGMALTALSAADAQASFTVIKINGRRGGIAGLSELSVVIGDTGELGVRGPAKHPLISQ